MNLRFLRTAVFPDQRDPALSPGTRKGRAAGGEGAAAAESVEGGQLRRGLRPAGSHWMRRAWR